MKDLIERLRGKNLGASCCGGPINKEELEAADLIEAQAARIAELEADAHKAWGIVGEVSTAHSKTIAELEAQIAEAKGQKPWCWIGLRSGAVTKNQQMGEVGWPAIGENAMPLFAAPVPSDMDGERYRYAKEHLRIGELHICAGGVEFDDWTDAAIDAAMEEGK